MSRSPSDEELAAALRYCMANFRLSGGLVMATQWAEGLARAIAPGDDEHLAMVRRVRPGFSESGWRRVTLLADTIRRELGLKPRFLTIELAEVTGAEPPDYSEGERVTPVVAPSAGGCA